MHCPVGNDAAMLTLLARLCYAPQGIALSLGCMSSLQR